MQSLVPAIVCFVLALASTAQIAAPQTDKTSAKPTAPCAVSGQVVTAADGTPLKSSRVVLIQQDASSHPQAFSATTDGDGRFEIKKVFPGRYLFFSSHTGYITQQYKVRGMNGGAELTLVPGQEVDDALFRLVRGAVITGRIVDESGEPIAKMAVTALRKLSAEEVEEEEDSSPRTKNEPLVTSSIAVTDDRGEYRIFDLKPGEYYVRAAESESFELGAEDGLNWITGTSLGSRYCPVFYPGAIQRDQAQSVVVAAGEEVRAEFAMRQVKTVEVAGRVLAADGKAASGAYVLLYIPEAMNWSNQLSTNTGAKGEFTIKGVPPGSYILTAQREEEGRRQFAQQKLEVGNENTDSVLLAFNQGATIRGRIVSVGASLPERVQIQLAPAHGSDLPSGGSAWSKPDGSFEMTGVLDGDYALLVYTTRGQGWYMKSAHLGGEDVLQGGLQLERASLNGTLEIVLSSAGAQLEGGVTDHDKPAGGAQVRARPEPETPYNRMHSKSATTDQNGHFIFHTLPPGKYRVSAKLPAASSEVPSTASEPEIVTLGEREHQVVQLTLAAPQNE